MLLLAACLIGVLAQAGPGLAGDGRDISLMVRQEPAPRDGPAAPQEPGEPGEVFIDLDRIELDLWGGAVFFSSDFEADPSFVAGISLRAPLPWLCREVLELPEDDFGLFVSVRFSSVERDITPPLEDDSGPVVLADIGLDYTFARGEDWRLLGQVGLQSGYFGGVTDLEDGFAALIGLRAGAKVEEGIWVTVAPQICFGDSGDFILLLQAGVLIEF